MQGECVEREGKGPGMKPAENWHVGLGQDKETDEVYPGRLKKFQEGVEPPKTKEQRSFKMQEILSSIKCHRPIQVRQEDGQGY